MVLKRENMKALEKEAVRSVERMASWLMMLPRVEKDSLKEENTIFLVIDIINGFAEEGGTLYSPRVKGIIPDIVKLLDKFPKSDKYFFCDNHNEDSPEFKSFPSHATTGSWESEVVDDLKRFVKEDNVVKKNSTNSMLAERYGRHFCDYVFDAYCLEEDKPVPTFVIVGDVTDICVMQAALTLKAAMNERNIDTRILLPVDCVDTYDLDVSNHDGDLMNLFALYNMNMNGIEVIANIE